MLSKFVSYLLSADGLLYLEAIQTFWTLSALNLLHKFHFQNGLNRAGFFFFKYQSLLIKKMFILIPMLNSTLFLDRPNYSKRLMLF